MEITDEAREDTSFHFAISSSQVKSSMTEKYSKMLWLPFKGMVAICAESKKYGLPKETLKHNVNGKVIDYCEPGSGFEQVVVDYTGYCSRHNFPLKRQVL